MRLILVLFVKVGLDIQHLEKALTMDISEEYIKFSNSWLDEFKQRYNLK
ncbi:9237_t:CDS:2, partial [Gigaspora margarita]